MTDAADQQPAEEPSAQPALAADAPLPADMVVETGGEETSEAGDLISAAVAAFAAGIVLVGTSFISDLGLLVGVALVQAALVGCWTFGTRQPGRVGGLVLGLLAAAAADVLVMVFQHGQLGTLLPVIGLALLVLFIHQLARGVVRTRVVESLSDTAVLVVAVVAFAALLELYHAFAGGAGSSNSASSGVVSGVVAAGALAMAAGYLLDTFAPIPRFDPQVRRGLLGVLVGGAIGAGIGAARLNEAAGVQFVGGRGAFVGAAVGLIAGLMGVALTFITGTPVVAEVARLAAAERAVRLRLVVTALVPLALISPVAYMLCLAIRA